MKNETMYPAHCHLRVNVPEPEERAAACQQPCREHIFPNSCDMDVTDKTTVSRSVCVGGCVSKMEG